MYRSVFLRLFPTVSFLFYLSVPSLVAKFSNVSHTEGKVPLQVRVLPIPVMHVETSLIQTMKKSQTLFGKLRRSHTTSNEIQQPGTSHLKSSPKNPQGIQQDINDTQESLGTRTPARAIISNLGHKGITLQQAQTANLVSDSNMFAKASDSEISHNKEERPGKRKSGFLSYSLNSSISHHKNSTASIIPNRRLPQQGTNSQQVTASRANLTASRKANLKELMTTPDARDYRNWKTFPESKIKPKAYQNPFVEFKWVRNQDPTIGDTFNRIKDRRGHPLTSWIQQRQFEPAPLMRHPETRLQIHNEDDSVLPDPQKIYGPCKDYDPRCPSLVLAGWCDYPTSFNEEINFRDYCMASCGFCDNDQKNKDNFTSSKRTEEVEENGFPEYNENFFKRHFP